MKSNKNITGTKEWAVHNVNCCTGCNHDCIYCYARSMALRFKRTTPESWPNEIIRDGQVSKARKKLSGTVMFPTTHDITLGNLNACETVLKKLLVAENRVLVVSKPHMECIERLYRALAEYKDQILFRFTIGVIDDELRSFWEPGAPAFDERLACLKCAFEAGFDTSVSCEPLLEPWNVQSLVEALRPFVTDSIWIGKANRLQQRTRWKYPKGHVEVERLLKWQTDEKVLEVYEMFQNDPLVKWKESYKD